MDAGRARSGRASKLSGTDDETKPEIVVDTCSPSGPVMGRAPLVVDVHTGGTSTQVPLCRGGPVTSIPLCPFGARHQTTSEAIEWSLLDLEQSETGTGWHHLDGSTGSTTRQWQRGDWLRRWKTVQGSGPAVLDRRRRPNEFLFVVKGQFSRARAPLIERRHQSRASKVRMGPGVTSPKNRYQGEGRSRRLMSRSLLSSRAPMGRRRGGAAGTRCRRCAV
jgi:hypothetical protein